MDELELRGVRVLIFVRHDVAIFRAAGFQHVGKLLEQPQREQNQIVKIHRVAGAQGGFVAVRMCSASARTFGSAKAAERSPPFLNLLNSAKIAAGSVFSPLAEMLLKIFFTAPSCSDSS